MESDAPVPHERSAVDIGQHEFEAAICPGDWVILTTLPPWVAQLPPESRQVLEFCVGRPYRVEEITEIGHLVLDVSPDIDARFGGYGNDIRVEPGYVTLTRKP